MSRASGRPRHSGRHRCSDRVRRTPGRAARLAGFLVIVLIGALAGAAGAPTAGAAGTGSDPRRADRPAISNGPGPSVLPRRDGESAARWADGRYIVTLAKAPVGSYSGGVVGIAPTRPQAGEPVQLDSPAAHRYRQVLAHDQVSVARAVGVTPTRRYTAALNGFAADLTASQAGELAQTPGVLAVSRDTLHTLADDRSAPDFMGLTGTGGVWSRLGGVRGAGRGVVIGVIDTGIWPEAHSFTGRQLLTGATPTDPYRAYRSDGGAGVAAGTIVQLKADGHTFTGACQSTPRFTAAMCTTKIVGARYFGDTFLAATAASQLSPDETVSPRDGDGHGTHTAAIAAGNYATAASIAGVGSGSISGVAPAASIASYKALWSCESPCVSGGYSSDIVAAIDQAVTDGVDVINYSSDTSTGSESRVTDPIQLAFLGAAEAGIFVAASAGNNGPTPSTLDNTAPWVTTVAASTMAPLAATVVLGNGTSYAGASATVQRAVGPVALVAGESVPAQGQSPDDSALCGPDSLDPSQVAGKIVECDRGVYERTVKSEEVRRAGGVGMVLANLFQQNTGPDAHPVPTVHLDAPAGPEVKAYAATPGATATLVPGNTTGTVAPYPQIAPFSSRGPSTATAGDLLKPDLAAPGVDVLSAVAPIGRFAGRGFAYLSGTSMAAPQVAGLAGLIHGRFPGWSPMAVKSALMTTAGDTRTADGAAFTDPFAQGAGQVAPRRMFSPGLVYDAGTPDWLGFLEGIGDDTGTGTAPVPAADLNAPSVALGALVGSASVHRRVTAVTPGHYLATAAVPGFSVSVSPSALDFDAPGQTADFTITLTRTTAPFGTYATGFLTWTGPGMAVRSPVAVRPLAVRSSAAKVAMNGAQGR